MLALGGETAYRCIMVLGRGLGGGGGGQFNLAATVSQLFASQHLGIGNGGAGSGANTGVKSCLPENASTVQSYSTALAGIVTMNIETDSYMFVHMYVTCVLCVCVCMLVCVQVCVCVCTHHLPTVFLLK